MPLFTAPLFTSLGYGLEVSAGALQENELFKCLTANATAASAATAQPWFPSAGAVTVTGDTTYYVEGNLLLSNGTTSHTTGINMGGTATITNWDINLIIHTAAGGVNNIATAVSLSSWSGTTAMSTNYVTNAGSVIAGLSMLIRGIIRVNAAGTLIPNFQWSVNPTGTNLVLRNTYLRLLPLGSGSVVSKGTWA